MLNVKRGDEVKSCLRGWGKVTDGDEERGFLVDFGSHATWFESDGKKRKSDIAPEIVEVSKKKWEPEGGEYLLTDLGGIQELSVFLRRNDILRKEGRAYKTKEQAEKSHKMIRQFQRLVAWVLENVPNYDPENRENYAVVLNYNGRWEKVVRDSFGVEVTMPEWAADKLANKLNSGEVEL